MNNGLKAKCWVRGVNALCSDRKLPVCWRNLLDCVWNVMAHAQKQDFILLRNGRVHLNRKECQFSRLLAAEVCASAVVMLDTPCSEVVWRVMVAHSIRQFPLHFPSRASSCDIMFQLHSVSKCITVHSWRFSIKLVPVWQTAGYDIPEDSWSSRPLPPTISHLESLFLYLPCFLLSITFLFMIAVPASLSSIMFLHLFVPWRVCDFFSAPFLSILLSFLYLLFLSYFLAVSFSCLNF